MVPVESAAPALLGLTSLLYLAVGVAVVRGRVRSAEDYVSARYTAGAWETGASLFAAGLGAWILFSPPEAAARTGIVALGGYALGSALAIGAFLWVGPRIRELLPQGHALTEFALHRFGRGMHALVLGVTAFYMFIYLTAELTAAGHAVNALTGIPRPAAVLVVLLATLAYTAYGGLRATLATDVVQAAVLVPLLLLVTAALTAAAGGLSHITAALGQRAPELLDPASPAGWQTALTLVIAILGANLFNQGTWQRVWVCRDLRTLRAALAWSALATLPVIVLAGWIGLLAQAGGVLKNPSAALFDLMAAQAPGWVTLAVLVLAITLVMSTADTLLNALVSLFAVEAARLGYRGGRLLSLSRWWTLLPAALAAAVAIRGYSVLYLFLIADLVCVAAAVPTFYGLYRARLSGPAAALTGLAGMVAGAWLFPDPGFTRGNLLLSFILAGAVPLVLCALAGRFSAPFDLASLRQRVRALD